jgi:hypothetical protein
LLGWQASSSRSSPSASTQPALDQPSLPEVETQPQIFALRWEPLR